MGKSSHKTSAAKNCESFEKVTLILETTKKTLDQL